MRRRWRSERGGRRGRDGMGEEEGEEMRGRRENGRGIEEQEEKRGGEWRGGEVKD